LQRALNQLDALGHAALASCYLPRMTNGTARGSTLQALARNVFVLSVFGIAAPLGCSSGGTDGSDEGWTCFETNDEKEPCQCQTTPVGGKQEIVDECKADSVQTGTEGAECCKLWLWVNGKPHSAYYCSCYAKDAKSCNTSIGDEIVERCP
jgi:hypothetical protein